MAENSLVQVKALANNEEIKSRAISMLGERGANLFINSVISVATSTLKNVDANSIWSCAIKAMALRLSIDPQLKYAALIPYNGVCSLQLMVDGYKHLAMRSGKVKKLIVDVVYSDELVRYVPLKGIIEFSEKPSEKRQKATAQPIGYYAYCELKDGYEAFVYMTRAEMDKWRDKYSKMHKANPKMSKWTDEYDKMALKTVTKRLIKNMAIMNVEEELALADAEKSEEVIEETTNTVLDAEIVEKKAKGKKIELAEAVEADEKEKSEELEAFGEAL